MPLSGRSITLCEIENGKGLERKNEWLLFSLKGLLPYNGKQSNSSFYNFVHPARNASQREAGGSVGSSDRRERARDQKSKPTHPDSIAWATPLPSGMVYGTDQKD